jgi:hypothetical protein
VSELQHDRILHASGKDEAVAGLMTEEAGTTPAQSETCSTCRFFRPGQRNGHCRRYPPQIVFAGKISEDGRPAPYADFPNTAGSNWCGEWSSPREALR